MERLYADPTGQTANMKQYAASLALINAESAAKRMHDKGLIITGEVTVGHPTVTKADVRRSIPHVTLTSCLDVSRWTVLHHATKKPASLPPERLTKYAIVTTIERWPEGWRVIRDDPQNKRC
ncbi:secreted protein/lipoprotein [Streptomyces sp. NPDC051098]|uniref:secreted protein/lipoprotein n=1 Tax=Streptomyces sp. NPDC051098 TaxID=3155411 RepID=UPI00343549B3